MGRMDQWVASARNADASIAGVDQIYRQSAVMEQQAEHHGEMPQKSGVRQATEAMQRITGGSTSEAKPSEQSVQHGKNDAGQQKHPVFAATWDRTNNLGRSVAGFGAAAARVEIADQAANDMRPAYTANWVRGEHAFADRPTATESPAVAAVQQHVTHVWQAPIQATAKKLVTAETATARPHAVAHAGGHPATVTVAPAHRSPISHTQDATMLDPDHSIMRVTAKDVDSLGFFLNTHYTRTYKHMYSMMGLV